MFCKNCGSQNEDGKFCSVCGARLEQEIVETGSSTEAQNPGKVMGIVSLVMGIVSLVSGSLCSCMCACAGGIVPLIISVVGLIMGILGMSKSKDAGFSNTPLWWV